MLTSTLFEVAALQFVMLIKLVCLMGILEGAFQNVYKNYTFFLIKNLLLNISSSE